VKKRSVTRKRRGGEAGDRRLQRVCAGVSVYVVVGAKQDATTRSGMRRLYNSGSGRVVGEREAAMHR